MIQYDPRNWLRVIFRLHGSVLPKLLPRVVAVAVLGQLAVWANAKYGFKFAPVVHTMVGVALGLLLVFRTNASFDRWWEGRKLLGAMVNRTRDLTRQVTNLIDGDDDVTKVARQELREMISGYFALTCQHLRGERELSAIKNVLGAALRERLEPIKHRPVLMLSWISGRVTNLLRAGKLSEQRLQLIDTNLTALQEYLAGAERIVKTPVPFAYAQHIKTFLALFTFSAPFVMVDALKSYTALAAAILAFGLFGIDEIGVEIEDPFGHDPNDLPLDSIGEGIEAVTLEIVEHRRGVAGETR